MTISAHIGHVLVTITDNTISSNASNSDLEISANGTGKVDIEGISFFGTTLSAADSSTINVNEGLVVDGTGNFSGTLTTADVSTTGTNTISGALTAGSLNIGDLNISADGSITSTLAARTGTNRRSLSEHHIRLCRALSMHTRQEGTGGRGEAGRYAAPGLPCALA